MGMLIGTRRALLGGIEKLKYLINDEFLTNIAAGSVDETPAEPGPGTRNVVDTNNYLSIAGGEIATSDATAVGDPCLIYKEAIARVAGRLGWGYVWNSHRFYLGFGNAITGAITKSSFCLTTGVSFSIYDTANVVPVGLNTAAVWYQTLIALRQAGAFYFVEGGIQYGNLELLYIGDTNADATLYYGAAHRVGGGDTTKWKNLKVPDVRWLPTPIASDGFGGIVGTTDGLGHAEGVVGGLGAGGSGVAWTDQVGTWAIAAGAKNCSVLAGGIGICTVPTTTPDLYISVEGTRNGSELGIIARYTDANNYLRAYHDGINIVLDEIVAGAPNNLITKIDAIAAGGVIALSLSGQSAWLFYDNAGAGTTAVINAGLTASTAGLYSTDILNTFDDFRLYARGTSGEYDNFLSEAI